MESISHLLEHLLESKVKLKRYKNVRERPETGMKGSGSWPLEVFKLPGHCLVPEVLLGVGICWESGEDGLVLKQRM